MKTLWAKRSGQGWARPFAGTVLLFLGLSLILGSPSPARPEPKAALHLPRTGAAREVALFSLLTDGRKAASFIRENLSAEDDRQKLFALSLAVEMGRSDSGPAIMDLLDDPNPRIRRRAALSLGRLGYEPARLPLEQRLAGRPAPPLARALICGLGLLGRVESIPALLPWLGHPDPLVGVDAAGVLGALGESQGLDLVLAGSRDPDPHVRLEAIYGLRFFRSAEAEARLGELASSPEELWRDEAGVSLAAGRLSRLKDDPERQAVFLSRLLDVPSRMIRRWAMGELSRLNTAKALEILRTRAEEPTRLGRLALRKLLSKGFAP